jgi:hypothetical protein
VSWRSHAAHGREAMLRMDAGRPAAILGRSFRGNPGHIPARQAVLAGQGHGRYNPRSPDAIPWDINDPHRGMHRGAVPAD